MPEPLSPEERTNVRALLTFDGLTVEDLKVFVCAFVDSHIRPLPYSYTMKRFASQARKLGTTSTIVLKALEAEGRIALKYSEIRKRTYIWPLEVYRITRKAESEGLDAFETVERNLSVR